VFAPYGSWENFPGTFWERQKKAGRATIFSVLASLSVHRFDLAFTYDVISILLVVFVLNLKKNGENLQDIFSLGLSDSVCIFTWYLNSVSINLLCLDIIESLWLYWPIVFPVFAKVG